MFKKCVECGEKFLLKRRVQKTCGSKKCREAYISKSALKYYYKYKDTILKKRKAKYKPKRYKKKCVHCSASFEAKRISAKFCSQKCINDYNKLKNPNTHKAKQKKYRERNKKKKLYEKKYGG